jgi:hypothetical protein
MKTTWMLLDSQLSGRGYKKQTQPGQHLFSQPDLLRDPFVNQNKWGGAKPPTSSEGFPRGGGRLGPKTMAFHKTRLKADQGGIQ